MFKPKYSNILLCLLAKYSVFFFILAFKGNRFEKMVVVNSENTQDFLMNLFYYLIYVMIYIILLILIFSLPFYYCFKIKKPIYFIAFLSIILISEYAIYIYGTSQKYFYDWKGIYNAILSLIFLGLFFHREIISIKKNN